MGSNTLPRILAPAIVAVLVLVGWHVIVTVNEIERFILPGPLDVLGSLIEDWPILWPSLVVTLEITFAALAAAVIVGVALAVIFTQSRFIEVSFLPYAVILQVTPIIAIAPLILIYVESTWTALLICAWVVAFFPILSNTVTGLGSIDEGHRELFELYGANRWQALLHLRLPASLPYFLAGLRIAGGLALIGAVVAEFAAGTAGEGSGLAFRILEAGYRLNTPRMFAALFLISGAGIAIFGVLSFLSWLVLRRWHESAVRPGE